ncbi:hypothetical protein E4U42_002539 [Claviceps africana]|uniref:Uncharacterized protein n=1 Tax=Claviceps africana TaxID=83212 RepID=A0A8K0NM77_9HYPO|nr:hypothetical protein E4U42_002539 [Claviceps africana]
MNTVRSFWLGWGSLCVAGGGAYYFAKREINADRQAKLEAARNKKQALRSGGYAGLEPNSSSTSAYDNNGAPARTDTAGSPSQEPSHDPAATTHAAATGPDNMKEKSKYESPVPYSSRKGDRFS